MSAFDLDDIQFVDNTLEEAAEAKRKIAAELARLQAIVANTQAVLSKYQAIIDQDVHATVPAGQVVGDLSRALKG